MHPSITIAKQAALDAGKLMLRYFENLDKIEIQTKRPNDLVSEVDIRAEQIIIQTLRKFNPDYAILGEESGHLEGARDDHQWIIDPLDGTTNYLHGIPHFCVSIALRQQGKLEAGVIYDPIRQEMFTASRGQGAQLNDRRIRVSSRGGLDGALYSTGLPPWKTNSHQVFFKVLSALTEHSAMMRRSGSAALDLAYVAAGRLDGFWEMNLNAWDIAAGALLIQEAGGLVGDFKGSHDFMDNGNIVAANPKVFKGMLQIIKPQFETAR
ncbi:MAG: inositol monophosphatase family protein [Gammaproteobacteria bacterium]